jgi:asparagine synthase (glutamine-hydrolysing)
MQDGKGRWIVFNGEIFNFLELRQELIKKGHCFSSGTDTEVLLHLYAEYGEDGFNKLNGMCAFAILDIPARRLVLSRDNFGGVARPMRGGSDVKVT